eukprot:TRINITY_DN1177_c0_g1_i4.p1 TRINITY_DN1177_c0_g1~~TRINITY_DN1177_c0_g1_i4.p1  ORF type:complete len:166 (+),score=42.81 TRINITY_DN1177_c0_g1_i4:119-616(+)
MLRSLVGSEMCIRDRYQRRVRGGQCEPLIGRMVEYETERTEQGFQRLKGGALLIVDPEELPEDVRKQKLAELAAFSCDMDTPEVTPVASYEGFVWSNTVDESEPGPAEETEKPATTFTPNASAAAFVPSVSAAVFVPAGNSVDPGQAEAELERRLQEIEFAEEDV